MVEHLPITYKALGSTLFYVHPTAEIKHGDQKQLRVGKGLFHLMSYRMPSRDSRQEPETEAMEECSLLVLSQDHA